MQRKRKISAATEASVWIENKTATGLSIVLNKLFDCLVSKKILLDSLQVLMSVCGCELTVTVTTMVTSILSLMLTSSPFLRRSSLLDRRFKVLLEVNLAIIAYFGRGCN